MAYLVEPMQCRELGQVLDFISSPTPSSVLHHGGRKRAFSGHGGLCAVQKAIGVLRMCSVECHRPAARCSIVAALSDDIY
jgi:hypothetical protein